MDLQRLKSHTDVHKNVITVTEVKIITVCFPFAEEHMVDALLLP
jgi:hypothetical protein